MFCSKCGKQIPDGARFCQGCGRPVNIAQPMPQSEQPAGTAQYIPQSEQPTGTAQSMIQSEQPAGTAQPMPQAAGRPTAPLPAEQPVKCSACWMMAYPGRGRCLICDTDWGVTVPPESGCGQEPQQATMPEHTYNQELVAVSESVQQPVLNEGKDR